MHQFIKFFILFSLFISTACAKNTLNFSIQGLKGDALTNVQSRLGILKNAYGETLKSADIQTIYWQSKNEIRKALEPYGYFNPSIQSNLHEEKSNWTVTFHIKPGPVLKLSKLEIKVFGPGSDNPAIDNFIKHFSLKIGDAFRTNLYEKGKEQLFIIADEQGYSKAYLEKNKIFINRKTNQAEMIIHFNTGPRYYFGQITFDKNPYAPDFLNRFISLSENEPFSSKKLLKLQQELSNTFYFQQVFITPHFAEAENHRVPLNISLTAPKSQKYSIGIGYGTFTGPRFVSGVSLRRITNSGQHFDAQLKLSEVLSGIAGKYYIPGQNPLTDQWTLGASFERFKPENGKSNSRSLAIGYMKKLYDVQVSLNLNYLIERYKVVNQPSRNSELLYPNLTLAYTNADDVINPHFGKSIQFVLQGAAKNILSSTSFLQTHLKAKYVYSPTDLSRLLLRGEFGMTLVSDINALPLSMRFFAGGFNNVRGFAESKIGPGRYLEVGSIEYQHKIYGDFSGAIFYDIGTASNQFNQHFHNGKGVGVIYQSIIGPIKLYLAKGKNYGVEFSIGPEF